MAPGEELPAIERAVEETGLEVALFNFDAGEIAAGDRGLLSDPERQAQFRENVPVALELADRIGCRRLNALASAHQVLTPGLRIQAADRQPP
jgi:hydroxypyruvate isomerase